MEQQINGFSMAFEDHGTGIPVLFIHGFPLSRQMWRPQINHLAYEGRVVVPDLRGHGDSQAVPGPYSMELLADDCAALLDAVGVKQSVVVCGLSMGGYVAFAFYRQYPERVAGLVLAATRAASDTPEGRKNRDKSAATAQEKGVAAVVESMLPKMMSPKTYRDQPELVQSAKEIMAGTSLQGMLGALQGMKVRPDSTPTLSQINKPTLIVHGADDQIVPLQEAEAMRGAIPGASMEVLPDAGHLLNLEQPELFNQAVLQFLSQFK